MGQTGRDMALPLRQISKTIDSMNPVTRPGRRQIEMIYPAPTLRASQHGQMQHIRAAHAGDETACARQHTLAMPVCGCHAGFADLAGGLAACSWVATSTSAVTIA